MAIKIAMQTYGWAAYGNVFGTRFGLETVLHECAAAGYRYVDLSGYSVSELPKVPQCRALFKKHRLQLVSMSCPIGDAKHEFIKRSQDNVRFLSAMGATATMVGGWAFEKAEDKLSESVLARVVEQADELHDFAKTYGIKTGYHNHLWGPVETEEQIDAFLARSKMGFCLDVGHLAAAGADPVPLIRRHGKRLVHVHLKDVVADRTGKFQRFIELGRGTLKTLNFKRIFKALDEVRYRGVAAVEQDNWSLNPGADALASAHFLKKLGRM